MMNAVDPCILLVDDDQLFAGIIAHKLKLESFKVEYVTSGEDALRKLQGDLRPDLMLLDIQMPGMNGFELLEKVRAIPAFAKLPVIIFSNFGDPNEREQSERLGVLRHVVKTSFTPQEVADLIHRCLAETTPNATSQ